MRRALLLVVVLIPLLAGCGAERGSDLDEAANALSEARTSRVDIGVASPKGTVFEASGLFDYARDVGELKLTRISDEFGESPFPTQMRFIGRDFYTGWSFGDKLRWQKEEAYEPTDAEEVIVPFSGGPAPDEVLDLLLKTSKRTQIFESEEIRGVDSKHYRLHVDPVAVLRETGVENTLDRHETTPFVVDVWIDQDGLVRRMRFPDEPDEETLSLDFYDFGVEVDVKAPTPAELIGDREFEKLFEAECEKRLKNEKPEQDDFCAIMVGSPSSDEGTGYGPPVETVPEP